MSECDAIEIHNIQHLIKDHKYIIKTLAKHDRNI